MAERVALIARVYLSIVPFAGHGCGCTGNSRHYTLDVLTSYDYEYAMGLFGSGRYEQVVDYCRLFADQGVATAQCFLGTMYQFGLGVDAEPQTAESLFLKSAEQGFSVAWCNLGTLYASGALGSGDHVRARFCYRRAAELGGPSNADYL